jgi:hypothetical protein
MSSFSPLKMKGRNVNQVLGVGASGRGEDIRKGCRRVDIVEIMYS